MADIAAWIKRHCPNKRRLAQLYSALLFNAHMEGFVTGRIYTGGLKAACAPGLNCYSCPGAIGACPLGALQSSISSGSSVSYIIGIIALFGLLLGRTICGWLCPMGLIQELINDIPVPKLRKSRLTRALSWVKYILLAVFVFALPVWYRYARGLPIPAFCKFICPAGTLEGAIPLLANPNNAALRSMLGGLFTLKTAILIGVIALCAACYRAFCRFLCPLGAIYGLFSRVALIGVKVDMNKCNGCGKCVRNCPMDVKRVGDRECIHCGRCAAGCPREAIAFGLKSAGRGAKPARGSARALRALACCAAIALLIAAIAGVNGGDAAVRPAVEQGGLVSPVGGQPINPLGGKGSTGSGSLVIPGGG